MDGIDQIQGVLFLIGAIGGVLGMVLVLIMAGTRRQEMTRAGRLRSGLPPRKDYEIPPQHRFGPDGRFKR